jgi:heme-degrading monooxygenase HmoA
MVLSVLEAHVSPDRAATFEAGYRSLEERSKPPGFVSTQLVRGTADSTLWRIETLWRDRAALDAMRTQGTPAGVLLFREVGAEPSLTVFDVVASMGTPQST